MVNNIYRNLGQSVVQIFGPEGLKTAQLVAEMTVRKHAQQAAAPGPPHGSTADASGVNGGGGRMGGGGDASAAAAAAAAAEPPSIPLLRSKDSFKVLTECPLIVMLLFQLYPKFIKANIPDLIPLMINALRLQAQLQRGPDGVQPVCLRGRYKEMIACQVCCGLVGCFAPGWGLVKIVAVFRRSRRTELGYARLCSRSQILLVLDCIETCI